MIAASDPQEYVPSGRQQALRHPGPLEQPLKKTPREGHDLLLNKFEKVSLLDTNKNEWWTLRKTPGNGDVTRKVPVQETDCNKSYAPCYSNKSHSEYLQDSSFRSSGDAYSFNKYGKRVSDASVSKFGNKRVSVGSEHANESSKSHGGFCKQDSTTFHAKLDPHYMEDELYVKGHTVVWSQGLINNTDCLDNGRKTVCCYTSPLPVQQALWCTFYCERPAFDNHVLDALKTDTPNGAPVETVCITDSHSIKVYTPKGEDFTIAIPFVITKLWSTKFGMFIEVESESLSRDLIYENPATLYSLAYPLDDVCPVALHQSNTVNVINNSNYKVVFTCNEPSLCMMYDASMKQHSVYRVRKLKPDERDFSSKMHSQYYSSANTSNKLKSKLSIWDNLVNSNNLVTPSPVGGKPNAAHLQQTRSYSSMAAMSRCQSPAVSSYDSPWPARANTSKMDASSKSFFDYSKTMSCLRSSPLICLDYLWTDNCFSEPAGAASKAFLVDDLVGQWYLCYLLTSKDQLCIVKIDFANPTNIMFGISTSISAKDAVALPLLHMLAILEHTGNVMLYSGLTVVGKLHVGGTLTQHTPSPHVRRYMNFSCSPFPRRSSLLPHIKQTDAKFDEHLLSPVLPPACAAPRSSNVLQMSLPDHDGHRAVLNGLIDAVENRMTLRYSDGTFYRVTMPSLASTSLIESCLITLRQVLQKDVAVVLLCKWYATKNVLGARDVSAEQEWGMFTELLFELLGYDEEQSVEMSKDVPVTPSSATKRQKHYSAGTDDDWNYLRNSKHELSIDDLNRHLKLIRNSSPKLVSEQRRDVVAVNPNSILFPYIRKVHYALHLLYEDLKLNTLRSEDLLPLMKLLNKLSLDLDLGAYSLHYWKDFPEQGVLKSAVTITGNALRNSSTWFGIDDKPPNIFQHIHELFKGRSPLPYPYLANVNSRSRDIVQLCGVLSGANRPEPSEVLVDSFTRYVDNASVHVPKSLVIDNTAIEQVVLLMVEMKITTRYLDTLPCRENPPSDWPADAYYLLWREDLAAQAIKTQKESKQELLAMYSNTQLQDVLPSIKTDLEQSDGMEDIDNSLTKLRFNKDMRVNEARKMLQSSKPVPIVLTQRPDVSDHDFIEEQEKHLYGICIRTMALPVGRGMFTLRTATPVITEPLPAPQLCLTGKAPPRGTTVDLNHIDTPANMSLWPLFHNGVANGLRITPDAHNIDNTWIIFNKSKSGVDPQMEHAGFLLALGLNGHLKNLALNSTFNYLEKLHEMTSVGILLGLSAAFRGTSHPNLTKTLAIHVEALLPPTSMELDVPQNLQVAGLLGIGLVYQGTAHRHMTEVLLSEIGRPPGPEMENSIDRESYSLAAGLSLGLVTLRHGGQPAGLSDLNVPDTLHYYMVGGNKRSLTGSQKDKYKTPSFQIREGSSVNLDVTAPGATLALGLMYLGTENKAVADWMAPPETQYLLDFIRPDFLMLRILARSLILWNDVDPSKEWVEGQVPSTIMPYCMVKPCHSTDVDYEAMNQAYCNIVAGACFAMGLKFAGTANKDAFETLLYFCHMFTSLTGKSIAELAGKSTIETCLNVLLLSVSMVMAGTGNLEIMRLVRHLRRRVGLSNSPIVTYGSHLAIHMALGLLFLGGGRYTLSNSPSSVAALICAFYPKFPTHSNDNRYHLQAFRHLYVLAVEPRLVIPKDIHLDEICYANLKIVKLNGTVIDIKAPGIIPDLSTLVKVAVEDERYWPVVFERGRNWELLLKILSTTGFIEVKQRAGCLSYLVDKYGYHSQLARTLTQSEVVPWDPSPAAIMSFTSDESVKVFCDHFLTADVAVSTSLEAKLKQMLSKITYDAVVKDKLIVILVFTSLVKAILELELSPSSCNIWQLKLVLAQVLSKSPVPELLSKEIVLALQQEVVALFDSWENDLMGVVEKYLSGQDFVKNSDAVRLKKLSAYVSYYDLPYKHGLFKGDALEMLLRSGGLPFEAVRKMLSVCSI
ncbi:hypothetical protein NQ315_012628 [Exocentrus adspersus]|uniref:Anaphase-promoting complex subunit 1 n=1 Tax=Exocentrus adspersus TaxID=1586481 RepID=A0AAV8VT98_9CUCU|nr:hypothetical protein NQ315_012628 [Exocentrus adspersus]